MPMALTEAPVEMAAMVWDIESSYII